MSHYALVNKDNIVVRVIVCDQDPTNIDIPRKEAEDISGRWLQTSYNTRAGVHYNLDGMTPSGKPGFRGNYAGLYFTYSDELDAFIPPPPTLPCTLDPTTFQWKLIEELENKENTEYESAITTVSPWPELSESDGMFIKPLLTFGYNAFLVTASANSTREFDLDSNGAYEPGIYYYISGKSQVTVKRTGEKLLERTAGWLSTEHTDYASVGNEKATNYFPKEAKWICIPHKINPNGLPNVSKLIIPAGTTQTILNGSNILICEGELVSNNIIYPVPSRFRPRRGDVSVSAITDVYALIFN